MPGYLLSQEDRPLLGLIWLSPRVFLNATFVYSNSLLCVNLGCVLFALWHLHCLAFAVWLHNINTIYMYVYLRKCTCVCMCKYVCVNGYFDMNEDKFPFFLIQNWRQNGIVLQRMLRKERQVNIFCFIVPCKIWQAGRALDARKCLHVKIFDKRPRF